MNRRLAQMLEDSRRVLLVAHRDPDGDALGATMGLMHLLTGRGQQVWAYSQGPVPEEYRFLPGLERLTKDLPPADAVDLAVLLDCHEPERTGPESGEWLAGFQDAVVIDHHRGSPTYGRENWVAPDYAATCEMLTHLAGERGWPIRRQAAACLYTGILTDTGSFRYSNTTPQTLRLTAVLLEAGADPWAISQEVYATRPQRLRLLGRVLDSLTRHAEGRLAVAQVSHADFAATGTNLADLEQAVEAVRGIPGVEVAVLLKELADGGVKVSMRGRGEVDLAAIAADLGGGGHKNAAGARLNGRDLASARRFMVDLVAPALEA